MSKFTTEVRYICESAIDLDESKGYNDVNSIIENSRSKIFNFNYPIYDETYRSVLETKILKHFYTREIGFETVGLWKLKLDTKMNEIMPYYNQLYKSALLEFNPFWTDDYSTLHNRKIDGINEKNEFSTSSANSSEEVDGTITADETSLNALKNTREDTSRDKYSDTPQGALTDLENDKYLTNARKITTDEETKGDGLNVKSSNNANNTSTTNSGTTDNNSMGVNTFNNTEDYLEYVQGRRGKDASEMLLKYRKTFLNIDMQVIDDLEELFLHLW